MYQLVVFSLMFGGLASGIQVNWNDMNPQVTSIVEYVKGSKEITSAIIEHVAGSGVDASIKMKTFASEPKSHAVIIFYEMKSNAGAGYFYAIFRNTMDALALENLVIMGQNKKPFGSFKSMAFDITTMDYGVFDKIINHSIPAGTDETHATPTPHSQSNIGQDEESQPHRESDAEGVEKSHDCHQSQSEDEKKAREFLQQLVAAGTSSKSSTTQMSIFASKLHLQIQFRIELKFCRRNRIAQSSQTVTTSSRSEMAVMMLSQ